MARFPARRMSRLLRSLGWEVHRIDRRARGRPGDAAVPSPPPVDPVWPLPRRGGRTDDEIRRAFAQYELWHYAYQFEGGLCFAAHHHHAGPLSNEPRRPLQRFRHFMPSLVQACGGTLAGKTVLDIACNSGFWSLQCALLGAEVVGFDSRQELIDQADLLKSIVGVSGVEFRVLDFWKMSPQSLGRTFDVVLNLGILYHLPKPLEALEMTRAMARQFILLDTAVSPWLESAVVLDWEEPRDIRSADAAGIVAYPSRSAIELMLRHIGASRWFEIPIRSGDLPRDYLKGKRASWLITV